MTKLEPTWRDTLIAPDCTLSTAMGRLDLVAMQILMVVDGNQRLLGTLTDGDIRRALLKGQELTSCVTDVMQTQPQTASIDEAPKDIHYRMKTRQILQMPVIDGARRVQGLHRWADILAPQKRDNNVILMAGGFGKRMMPHTKDCPKPMLRVAGKPILQHTLERVRDDGFRNFIFTLHYLPDTIREYFGDGSRFGVDITYVEETSPLGTAGALSLISTPITEPFLIANGDILCDLRLSEMLEFHTYHKAMGTMAVQEHVYQNPFGVVEAKGVDITGFTEKPKWRTKINAGLYVLKPDALSALTYGENCTMPDLFSRLKDQDDRVIAYPIRAAWMDVGNPQDLLYANERWGALT